MTRTYTPVEEGRGEGGREREERERLFTLARRTGSIEKLGMMTLKPKWSANFR
jgi:hypothetical protein